ncbi:hypothetical protein M2192_000366 [Bradyrhizobium elkanii USDA 61]|uniref:Uncharacterized protein n=1 Tax=Bradyrhizobium elkanii TaxID=29448 RepID=A0A8I1Y9G4_BRAEL|nr:hypothetical protein [Bradyrhizobium sp. CCBAU 21365]MBP1295765.1 hypothetical protein [Bradyrhizobium elkanii]MCS4003406.1 hypothetical protein [Bradyrhizobium elkanii USDA 61]MCP1933336.1 hypothetical protein [Bradyrhizobium elkanii]MCS3478655.1 hypothetical protein [Bradyrhizobium elkanii]MCS3585427.1 hypothetical protein [Bradyrhizobium elkanii]
MNDKNIVWQQDGVDPGWFTADHIGSIRNSTSYRPGGWWFLPAWLPDTQEHDVGPFKTKTAALAEAERLYASDGRRLA